MRALLLAAAFAVAPLRAGAQTVYCQYNCGVVTTHQGRIVTRPLPPNTRVVRIPAPHYTTVVPSYVAPTPTRVPAPSHAAPQRYPRFIPTTPQHVRPGGMPNNRPWPYK